VVAKREVAGRTVAGVTRVEGDARVDELSRMLTGLGGTDTARRHAAELLDSARGANAGAAAGSRRRGGRRAVDPAINRGIKT
jgi:DNA repair protein RecN (Recombination protein N)